MNNNNNNNNIEKKKTILKICVGVLIISFLLIVVLLSNKEEPEQNEPEPTEIETESTMTETFESEPETETETSTLEVVEFTEKQKTKVEQAFTSFMDNAEYQTTLNEGDTVLYVVFKGLGTVKFKLYEEYAPDSIDWMQELIENETRIRYDDKRDGGRLGNGNPQFKFVTTDRKYNRKEQVPEIFPMKYCLYHILQSCNNFYFCTMDYLPNITDSYNVPQEYLNYLSTYGGNMSVYESSVVLGRAVENQYLLDNLTENFQIESMTMVRNGKMYSATYQTEEYPEEPENVVTEPETGDVIPDENSIQDTELPEEDNTEKQEEKLEEPEI